MDHDYSTMEAYQREQLTQLVAFVTGEIAQWGR